MKISEMTNDQACEAMIRISQPLSNMMEDEDLKEIFDDINSSKDIPLVAMYGKVLPKIVMLGMKKHKADLYEIIGALTFTATSKVAKMNFLQTLNTMKESIDEDFLNFFRSSGNVTAKPGAESAVS